MHRRTMLLQSLIALSASECDGPALVNLTTQLANITCSCDRLMEEMLRISDQRSQVQRLQDVHDASALAMALRKLNGSYAKRTAELQKARSEVEALRAELNKQRKQNELLFLQQYRSQGHRLGRLARHWCSDPICTA